VSVLKKILRHVRLPVRHGPNAGRWWSVSTGSRYLRGDFVKGKASCLERLLRPGETVWDIGAHRGFTVLVETRVVGSTGRVFAFEPNPESRNLLELHLKWNGVTNAKVYPYAMGRTDGEMSFGWARDPSQTTLPALEKRASTLACHLGGEGHTVPVRYVDGLIAAGIAASPTLMKIDVEGAELDVLEGAAALLQREPQLALVLATHTPALHDACCALLRRDGFEIVEAANVATARREGWAAVGDADVLAFRPARGVPADVCAAFAAIDLHG
jgi:FkbM family methyltransferase